MFTSLFTQRFLFCSTCQCSWLNQSESNVHTGTQPVCLLSWFYLDWKLLSDSDWCPRLVLTCLESVSGYCSVKATHLWLAELRRGGEQEAGEVLFRTLSLVPLRSSRTDNTVIITESLPSVTAVLWSRRLPASQFTPSAVHYNTDTVDYSITQNLLLFLVHCSELWLEPADRHVHVEGSSLALVHQLIDLPASFTL